MIILSIDAATPTAAVAVSKDGVLLAEQMLNIGNTHSVQLMPMIVDILSRCGLSMHEIDAVATSQGPGSFTGLRIGMATAKALVQGSGCRLIAIPTLDVLAENLWNNQDVVCPILNAKKNEVYTALYRANQGGMERLSAYQAIAPKDLAEILRQKDMDVCFLGDGVPVYQALLTEYLGERAHFAPLQHSLSRGASLASLAHRAAQEGNFGDLFLTQPMYIRKCEAQLNWEAAHPGEYII